MKQFTSTRLFAVTSVVAAMLAAGCSEENNAPSGNASNAAIVTASIGKTDNVVFSRAANTVWDVDDCIGISTSSVNGKTNYVNIRYKTDGNVFSPVPGAAGEDNTIYFQDKSPTTFTAYYPYEGANGTKPGSDGIITKNLTVADQSPENLPAIDYLWAQQTAQSSNPKVDFRFSHRMSRLILNFKAGAGTTLPTSGLTYTLTQLATEGTFDTSTGEAKATGTVSKLENLPTSTTGGQITGIAILWPQAVSSMRLQLKLGDTTFGAALTFPAGTAGEALAPSTSYTFNVTVERTGITVGQADIDDWTSGGSKDITLQEARTLTFDPNGGSGTIAGDKVFEGATTSLPGGNGLTPPSGKTFVGWNTLPRGGGEFYAAGSTLTMPAGDFTLYAQWSGDGSDKDEPILITDAQGMKDIGASQESMGKHYRLCNDLVLDDWEAIYYGYGASRDEGFSGTFDGGGHTVTLNGVKPIRADFNMAGGYFISLFACIQGEVRRLRVDGQITVDGTDENVKYYAGGICGYIYGGTVTDCISDVTVTAMGKMDILYAGSIAGYNALGPIFNCYATGKIESTAIVKYVYLGGIAGFNDNCIANCAAFNSNISGNKGQLNTFICRIAYNTSANIVNNYASATSAAFTDKGLNKRDGADCDAKPAASWWKEPDRWADSYTIPTGSTKTLTPWNFGTTWEVTDGNLPVLRRK
ncbi:fimbrillin family protein [Bacteroides xylanisolvens]|uniref:fimbrillin family protein n=1 Tax=Bacteroides xylanisolvens TaxID=371601 RepID=UPI002306EFE1|nr:fimbrillin family protein [Bacteroides xylanisolvens]MDB0718006.1 fimbrillin family protein [Bacteroides xylanisolvens]MDB0736263.1 fimbrillin family protein [Bacteroides xylanisolvens]